MTSHGETGVVTSHGETGVVTSHGETGEWVSEILSSPFTFQLIFWWTSRPKKFFFSSLVKK